MKNPIIYLMVFTLLSSITLLNFSWNADAPTLEEEKEVFNDFIQAFPLGELPYEITMNAYLDEASNDDELKQSINKRTHISTKFAQLVPGLMRAQYSRTPSPSYYYESKLFENEQFAMVVYSIEPAFTSVSNQPNEYVLATYKKGGDIENHKRLLSSVTLSEKNKYLRLGKVNEDLTVQVKSYHRDLSSDIGKGKLHSTKEYSISTSGAIAKTSTKVHTPKPQKKAKAARKANRAH